MRDNKSFCAWVQYYSKPNTLINFKALLNTADKSFLFQENKLPYDDKSWDLMPARGFLEKDFLNVLNSFSYDNLVSAEELLLSKTRLILALESGIKFDGWLDFFGDDLTLVFARCLVEGRYEEFGIQFENIIKEVLTLKLIAKNEFFGVALMRGNILKKRYPTEKEEKELDSFVRVNKIKVKIREKIYRYI